MSKALFPQEADAGSSQDSDDLAAIQPTAEILPFSASCYYHSGKQNLFIGFAIINSVVTCERQRLPRTAYISCCQSCE